MSTMKHYSTVEIVSSRVSDDMLGDFTVQSSAPRNTTLRTVRPRIALTTTQSKNCLANLVPGLAETTTIVHISDFALDGTRLTSEEFQQAMWFATEKFGVPMWTQSSFKSCTFYFVATEMFLKLASKWNMQEDAHRFASYIGLLFSDMGNDGVLEYDVPTIELPNDGQDGSCTVGSHGFGAKSCQIRGMVLEDGLPVSLAKGIIVPVKGEFAPRLNTNQVKHGKGGHFIVMTNGDEKLRKFWASAEATIFLKDTPFVRNFLAQRVRLEVADYLALLTPDRKVDLLRRLGGLTLADNGQLESAKRLVIEALRSKLPWCKETEERITRFAINEICTSIVPSGGIQAWLSTLVISNEHGEGPVDWNDARAFAFRVPVTGANAFVPLKRNPYVRGKGMVVTAEVAKLVSGDDDYDQLAVIDDPELVNLYRRFLNREIVTGIKPEKHKAHGEITADFMVDMALKLVSNNWLVGGLTVAGWKMIEAGLYDLASQFLDMANTEPMTYKHHIEINGLPFHTYAMKLYSKNREALAEMSLQWRDAAKASADWNSPRDLAAAAISNPKSVLDCCWNAAVEAAAEWDRQNPLKPLVLASVARIAFGENGIKIPGSAFREAREMINWWGKYWAEHRNDPDNSAAYQKASEWGKTASREAKAAMLLYRPKSGRSGFGLKWHTGSVCCDVLGMDKSVAEAVKSMRNHVQDLEMQAALVQALFEAVSLPQGVEWE